LQISYGGVSACTESDAKKRGRVHKNARAGMVFYAANIQHAVFYPIR
jgi:hypothetical protein